MNRWKAAGLVLGGVSLIGIATGSTASASIPDSNGTIHACYLNLTGAVTIIDSATSSCIAGQTAVTWPTSATQGNVHTVSVSSFTPSSPADTNGTGFIDESFDCTGGKIALSGVGYLAQNPGINVAIPVTGYHVSSGSPVGMTFMMPAGLTGSYSISIQVECALPA